MHVIEIARRRDVGVASVIVGLASLIGPVATTSSGLLGVVEHLGIIESALVISVAAIAH